MNKTIGQQVRKWQTTEIYYPENVSTALAFLADTLSL